MDSLRGQLSEQNLLDGQLLCVCCRVRSVLMESIFDPCDVCGEAHMEVKFVPKVMFFFVCVVCSNVRAQRYVEGHV